MATLVLQGAGAALGSQFGPIGAAVGRAAGALVGNTIDRSLFAEDRLVQGSRLTDLQVQESREGAPIPRVFGRARLSGQVIWATEFEEVTTDEELGGKGSGPTTTTRNFSYFGNFAVALCEGEISRVGRIWADGELLDTNALTMRIYLGDEQQEPDSLISAKQGLDKAPAYRGTAYVVFERMPLANYGNRLPQLSFEVVRGVGELETQIKAIQLIPGASEFIYDTNPVIERDANPLFASHNRHVAHAPTDFEAALDELTAICPSMESVALVSAWFGSDLRCSHCQITPKVETQFRNIDRAEDWRVAGIERFFATTVSQLNGSPAFGGSPSDAGLVRSIQNIKSRGLKVTYNPFVMMDVPNGNQLPDPYSDNIGQATYPWRGRITASIAPNLTGSPDGSSNLRAEVDAFLGTAAVHQFSVSNGQVSFAGGDDWGYRRFILHAAHLCALAGGVDTFLIGSEMRSLTLLRDEAGRHPFVEGLIALAADVRSILGPDTIITYGADWSEYFGHHPQDGSGDVLFHLDALWSDENINAIGIDNYMPLADWRDGSTHLDAQEYATIYDAEYLDQNIKGGEGFDWFYASEADRQTQNRTPITDGAYSKPWVFRYKDLVSWWSNQHFERHNGVEANSPTAWLPQSKPIIFTEVGVPAIDKAANQPNVFFDPNSSEGAIPHFSAATRDDNVQRASLAAIHQHWAKVENNPISSIFDGPMVDTTKTHIWAWDLRPYPLFPQRSEIWADSENWRYGHWLNGRLGSAPLGELIQDIVKQYTNLDIDVSDIHDTVDGYVISDRVSARNALETLLELYQIDLLERSGSLIAISRHRLPDAAVENVDYVHVDDTPEVTRQREQSDEIPSALSLAYQDIDADFRAVTCSSRRLTGERRRNRDAQLPIVSTYERVLPVVEQWLRSLWLERDRLSFAIPQSRLDVEVGDVLQTRVDDRNNLVVVTRIEEGLMRRVQARTVAGIQRLTSASNVANRSSTGELPSAILPPNVVVLDLPVFDEDQAGHAPQLAINANHWTGGSPVALSNDGSAFQTRQTVDRAAAIGTLRSELGSGVIGVFDNATMIEIDLPNANLSSVEEQVLFSGRNVLAVQSRLNTWELLQFGHAELIGPNRWKLSKLLRAQLGTEDALEAGFDIGATVVLINGAIEALDVSRSEADRSFKLKAGLLGREFTDQFTTQLTVNPVRRGLKPLSPVHLKATRNFESGDIALSWIRRTRVNGDVWEAVDVPLAEEQEQYIASIKNGAQLVRTFQADQNNVIYSKLQQIEDFGEAASEFDFEVAQLSASEGAGVPRSRFISL